MAASLQPERAGEGKARTVKGMAANTKGSSIVSIWVLLGYWVFPSHVPKGKGVGPKLGDGPVHISILTEFLGL